MDFKPAIMPSHIDRVIPDEVALWGVFGNAIYETMAAQLLARSQQEGCWTGYSYPSKQGKDSHFHKMINLDLLSERKDGDDWHYELTQHAIELIYLQQSQAAIAVLEAEVRRAHYATLWDDICKWLRRARSFLFGGVPT